MNFSLGKDPNQVTILVNGICKSASGFFASALRQNKYGTFVAFSPDNTTK